MFNPWFLKAQKFQQLKRGKQVYEHQEACLHFRTNPCQYPWLYNPLNSDPMTCGVCMSPLISKGFTLHHEHCYFELPMLPGICRASHSYGSLMCTSAWFPNPHALHDLWHSLDTWTSVIHHNFQFHTHPSNLQIRLPSQSPSYIISTAEIPPHLTVIFRSY